MLQGISAMPQARSSCCNMPPQPPARRPPQSSCHRAERQRPPSPAHHCGNAHRREVGLDLVQLGEGGAQHLLRSGRAAVAGDQLGERQHPGNDSSAVQQSRRQGLQIDESREPHLLAQELRRADRVPLEGRVGLREAGGSGVASAWRMGQKPSQHRLALELECTPRHSQEPLSLFGLSTLNPPWA